MKKVFYGFDYDSGIFKVIVRPTTKEDIETVFGKDSLFSQSINPLGNYYTATVKDEIFGINIYNDLMNDLYLALGELINGI